MTKTDDNPDKKAATTAPRRSQAQRRESTRQLILDAAIECLATDGYAATTTIAVVERAGISRGGMLHHFPSKLDLIVAVMEGIESRLDQRRREQIHQLPKDQDRFTALTDIAWQAMKEPEEIAMLEILLASRGDPDLALRLPKIAKTIDATKLDGMIKTAHHAGIDDPDLLSAMHHLHQAAMRGLMLERLLYSGTATQTSDDAIELLKRYKRLLMDDLSDARSGS